MKNLIACFLILSLVSVEALAQKTSTTNRTVVKRRAPPQKTKLVNKSFYYANTNFFSFADQVFAKVAGEKVKAHSVFSGYSIGVDYTTYVNRYVLGWNLNLMSGTVDIERVKGQVYPRKTFTGVQSGPEIGYRVNSDLDLTYSAAILYRNIEKIGGSFALANQANVKFRLTPRLTFFQSFGNYGKPTAYSYSVGLRWLL